MSAPVVALVLVLVLGVNVVLLVMFAHLCGNVRAIKDAEPNAVLRRRDRPRSRGRAPSRTAATDTATAIHDGRHWAEALWTDGW